MTTRPPARFIRLAPAACVLGICAALFAPPAPAGEAPPVEEIFEYLNTFDFAKPGFGFPEGISSLSSQTGTDEFANAAIDTNGKNGSTVNGIVASRLNDEERAGLFFFYLIVGELAELSDTLSEADKSRFATAASASFNIVEGIDARTYATANSDPYLARRIEITNPYNETITFRFEDAIESVGLDPLSAVGAGRFAAQVFDTGGDPGAQLEFNLGHTLRQAESGDDLSVEVGHSGLIQEGELSTHEVGPLTGFAVALEEFDRILSSAFLTISPGDTAVVTTIGNFGDDTFPLTSLDLIESDLAIVTAVGDSLLVLEPTSLALLGVGCLATRRRRRDH